MTLEKKATDLTAIAHKVNAEHRACEEAAGAALGHAINAGELLTEVKAGLPHGSFGAWLQKNFAGSDRTARAYMRVYANREELEAKRQSSATLSLDGALKELSTPKEVRPSTSDGGGAQGTSELKREKGAAEKAWDNFSAIMQRLHELAAGIDVAGGIRQILRHQPEQNQRIFANDYRALLERGLRQVEEFERDRKPAQVVPDQGPLRVKIEGDEDVRAVLEALLAGTGEIGCGRKSASWRGKDGRYWRADHCSGKPSYSSAVGAPTFRIDRGVGSGMHPILEFDLARALEDAAGEWVEVGDNASYAYLKDGPVIHMP